MITLPVNESQLAFRTVLNALAHPGATYRLPDTAVPPAVLPTLALADLGTAVCLLEEETDWVETVVSATSAPLSDLNKARLVTALRAMTVEEIAELHRGTALAPEDGALVTLAVSDVDGGPAWRLTGPGVPGEKTLAPQGLPAGFVAARAELVAGFPAGADFLLVCPDGRIAGLPRTTTIEEES
ncbi:phosphonate C-P lyase system protein PhnH [Amycolatopsis sp. WGS_07]|uniref:phosphonate C-P lyase system protein PhnH n=1 Tax=Amycolatopsis sp. WGS_07 TaxID=3076764 RepID=UPI003873B124